MVPEDDVAWLIRGANRVRRTDRARRANVNENFFPKSIDKAARAF
jgi:hypothetical protein